MSAILYVSSDYRDIVFLGNAPIPKYKAPWHRPLYYLAPDGNEGSQKVPRPAQFEDALFILALIWPRSRAPTLGTDEFRKVRAEVPSAQFRPKILT